MRQDIHGFRLDSELHQGQSSLVYRGVRLVDELPVVLKVLKNEFPTPQETARYEREYRIAGPLQLRHSVRVLDLQRQGHRSVLVYADDGAISLRRLYGGRALEIGSFLRIATAATRALAEVHAARLIHCDLNPANLLVHPESEEVLLTDFELARRIDHTDASPSRAMGTLAYMAPEQSGRSSLRADQRADLYSLGASLFELATGRQVFIDLDDASLLHAHFAVPPPLITDLRADFPPHLDAIVHKLLAKMPSERYQSARGLLADLERASAQWQRGEVIQRTRLGEADRASGLQLDRLIGRDAALNQLHDALAEAGGASKPLWLRIVGTAGSGKSTLLAHFAEQVPTGNVLLIGRAEPGLQNTPYGSLISAFDALIQHWLSLSEIDLSALRAGLQRTLGNHLGVLLPLLPRLGRVLGELPRPLPLGPTAEQARFQLALRGFLQFAADRQKPLLVCIDDLQWADAATLQALEKLLGSDVAPSLLLTAERSDGAPAAHREWIERLTASDIRPQRLPLPPLTRDDICTLIDASVGRLAGGTGERDALISVVLDRTLGNPFFVRQLLEDLVRSGVLSPADAQGERVWQFDHARTANLAVAANVLDLLSARVEGLPPALRDLLQHAACIGHAFDLETLRQVLGEADPNALAEAFASLVEQGLLRAEADGHGYRFSHERLRDAALALLSDEARAPIHLAIGRLWLADPRRSVFERVGQLNLGVALIGSDDERLRVALLNAEAARLARSQTAFDASLDYAGFALSLLPTHHAAVAPTQVRELHMLLADAQASAGHLDAAIQVFAHALALTDSPAEQALVLERTCDALQSSGQPAEALQHVQRALALLGQPLALPDPSDPFAYAAMQAEQARLFAALGEQDVLLTLASLTNADAAAGQISRLFDKAIIGVYFSRPELLGLVTARSVEHVLKTGLTPEAALAFGWWSMMLCIQDKHALATEFAQWTRTLHARFGDDYYGGGGRMVAAAMTLSWTRPYAESYAEAGESARLLHQSGNTQFASYGLITQHIIAVAEAADCQAMLATCEAWGDYCTKHVPLELGQAQIRRYCIARLMGLDPPALDCEAIVASYAAQNNATDVCESLTEMARFALLTDDFAAALALCERAHPLFCAGAAGNLLLNFNHLVMLAISAARCGRSATGETRARRAAQFTEAAARVQHLSALQAQNFSAWNELVRAEGALLRAESEQALAAYFACIRHAQQHGYVLLQAQATQYLAELLREQGHHFAYSVQRDAELLYQRAGCLIKVYDRASLSSTATTDLRTARASRSSDLSLGVDVLSLMKANEAITAEMDYDRLLARLLEITVENAGAQRGALVLREDGELMVVATSADGRLHEPLEHSQRCPQQMILYVARSGLASVLESGPRRSSFREEPYFETRSVRSVLAAPLLRQGKVTGVMYLENDAVDGAFGHDRLEAIRLLLGAAAIALENASLYGAQKRYADELEARVRSRTEELEQANAALARLADLDGLTQIANRRGFDQRCQDYACAGAAVTLLLCDVDDFKAYNDHYGHPAGDEVLRQVARTLSAVPLPGAGLVARYGGEEFAVLLRDIEPGLAEAYAQRVQQSIGAISIPHVKARAAKVVTLSVGVARAAPLAPGQIETLIANADKALYVAKQLGRNRLSLHAHFARGGE